MPMTGGEIFADYLIAEGVPYVCGIPGHGDMGIFDALKDRQDKLTLVKPRHEQSAAHIADAYYRVSGNPLATVTSIGPGSINTITGVASAFVDSVAMVTVTGGPQTYMYGTGVLQEIERHADSDFSQFMRPAVKRSFVAHRVDRVPSVIARAFNEAVTGRPGPVHVEMPMDVQADYADVEPFVPSERRPAGRIKADPAQIDAAARMLIAAERPVILAGGGCLRADAAEEVRALAEYLQAPVITTMMSKGLLPEDHPLCAQHTGACGTSCGNALTAAADVILAVGTRFAEQTASSYVPGESFNIPPTKLIHFDIDPYEIGKNYPVAVGAVCDAKTGLADLLDAVTDLAGGKLDRSEYVTEVAGRTAEWWTTVRARWRDDYLSMSRVLAMVRDGMPRNTIAISSAGHPQIQAFQEFPAYVPWISPGGYSTMGYTLPAAIGAKLASPESTVIALAGDGDLMQTIQELHLAAELGIDITIICLNNAGWVSIRDFQRGMFGEDRPVAVDFLKADGTSNPVDFTAVARAMGCEAETVTEKGQVNAALGRANSSGGPYLIDFRLSRDPMDTEGINVGHWDLPKPAYLGGE
ncbi:thiamine pyrophosphate-binding protein [bacterium]|nr:thiamine pyrophosphate-binding protein [bacterium]